MTVPGPPPHPTERATLQQHDLDPVRDRMVVFGGHGLVLFNEVWALSLAGAPAWTQLTPPGDTAERAESHSAIYDPVRDRMVVFGGSTAHGPQRRLGAVAGGHAGLDAADADRHAAGRAVGPQRDLRPGARPHGGLRGTHGQRHTPQRRLGAVAGGHAGLDAADAHRHAAGARLQATARSTTRCATAWWSSGATHGSTDSTTSGRCRWRARRPGRS